MVAVRFHRHDGMKYGSQKIVREAEFDYEAFPLNWQYGLKKTLEKNQTP